MTRTTKKRVVRPIHGIHKRKVAKRTTMRMKAIDQAAKCVPMNWRDPLLTGPKGIGSPPYDCRHIEKLLRGIQDSIRALKGTP